VAEEQIDHLLCGEISCGESQAAGCVGTYRRTLAWPVPDAFVRTQEEPAVTTRVFNPLFVRDVGVRGAVPVRDGLDVQVGSAKCTGDPACADASIQE
jgi:hypothetical protein